MVCWRPNLAGTRQYYNVVFKQNITGSVSGRDKSPKGKKDDKADKGKKGGAPGGEGEDDAPTPPPPLEIHVLVKLHHWKTATDSMRTEQDGELPQSDV